ncbi:MAG: high-affinity nickel-transport family protein [Gemmatimonadetes bacterium]|nr:high-affinity nickel-transport family protein [Gemmatimonadota bacterium]
MLSALSAGLLGFLLGLKHATDADHVVAVTAIVARERTFRRAAWIGGLWGIGHSLTVFVVGGAIVVFRLVIPPRVGLGLEFGVALMLILLGFSNLRGSSADAASHTHPHPHPFNPRRPVMVGIVHGLAGSAAVAILVLTAIPDTWWALAYLLVFGVGTIVGMMVVTGLLAAPAVYAGERMVQFQRGIRLAAGTLSVVFGLLLAREIVINGGLFRAVPQWSPR